MSLNSIIDGLVYKYISGNLIPILGCELFNVESKNKVLNIHEYIINESFYPSDEWTNPPQVLSELPLAVPDFDQNSLLGCYKSIPEKSKNTDLLIKLARLKNFKVFLLATVFKEFENEYSRIHGIENIEVYKNTTISQHGLPEIDLLNDKTKLIYLFDNIESEICSIGDEQILESIIALSNTKKGDKKTSLLTFLENKTLLFIGCDFPDWFMRYCIRVLYNNPLTKRPTYIVNNHPPKLKYQEFFFEKHNIQLIQTSPVSSFVEAFYNKAISKQQVELRYKNSQVFICYSSKYDANIARKLYQFMVGLGVDTFFDENSKEIGQHEKIIKAYIMNPKTKLFISVLSKKLVEDFNSKPLGSDYIRDVELKTAEMRKELAAINNPNDNFDIVPYFVDNEKEYLYGLPKSIDREFRFGELNGGFEKLFEEAQKKLS